MKKTVAILLLLTLLSACSNSNSFDLADYQELTIGDVLAEIPKVWQSTPEESYEYYFEAQSCRLDFGVVENELVFKMAQCENKDDYKKMIDTISFDEAIIQLETEGKLSRDKYVSLYDGGEYIEGLVITDAGIMNYYETPDSAMIFNPEADYYTLDTIQGQHVIPKPMLVEENISPALWFHTQHRFMTGYHYNDYYFLYTD